MRSPVIPAVFFLLALLVVPAQADEVLEDAWQRLHLAGAPAGFTHTVVRRVEAEEGPRIETTSHTEMSINRMGSVIEVVTDEITWETPEGGILQVESRAKISGQEQKTLYRIEGTTLKVATTVLGQTRESEVEILEGVLGPYEIGRRTSALAGTTGEIVEALSFMADMGNAVLITATSKGPESVSLLDGKTAELTRVESVMEGLPMRPVEWLDAEGQVLKSELKVAGMHFETYEVASEEEAKSTPAGDATLPPDVFTATLLDEPGPVPAPRHLQAAVIEMRPKTEDGALPAIESEAHTVVDGPDGVRVIYAKRSEPPRWVAAVRPIVDPPAELADALAANSMIQSDAEEIRQIAEEVVGDETDAWRAAQTLERWVYVNLTNKGFGVAFASALEVCRNREGDCTEHAVFLAALCRAAGIPARVVMGAEYLMGIWGGHAWNEVWIDGEWYALDATNGYGFADPLHLPMAHMTLKDTGFAQEFTGLLGGLGQIQLDVVEVTHRGKRVRVDDPALVKAAGGRYTDRVWGIAFSAPDKFTFDPPPERGLSARLMGLDGTTASGKKCEIEVTALDVPAVGIWDVVSTLQRLRGGEIQEAEVDGRPARRLTISQNGRRSAYVAVIAGDTLFLVEMDRVEGDAEREAFESFLESVDFDLR